MDFFEKVGETVLKIGGTVLSGLDSLNTALDSSNDKKRAINLTSNGGNIMGSRLTSTVLALGVTLVATVATSIANAKKNKEIKKLQAEKDQISTENGELKKENEQIFTENGELKKENEQISIENDELKKENDLYKEKEKQAAEERARIESEKAQIENFGLDDMIDSDIMEIINGQ